MTTFRSLFALEWRRIWSTKRWIWPLAIASVFAIPYGYLDGIWMLNVHARGNVWDFVLYMLANPFAYGFAGVSGYCLWLGDLFDADVARHYRWYLMMHMPSRPTSLFLGVRGLLILATAVLQVVVMSAIWFVWGWHLFGLGATWSTYAHAHSIYWPMTPAVLGTTPLIVTLHAIAWAAAGIAVVAMASAALAIWTNFAWSLPAVGTTIVALAVWLMPFASSVRWNVLAQAMWIMHPPAFPGGIAPPEQASAAISNWWAVLFMLVWAGGSGAVGWARLNSRRDI